MTDPKPEIDPAERAIKALVMAGQAMARCAAAMERLANVVESWDRRTLEGEPMPEETEDNPPK